MDDNGKQTSGGNRSLSFLPVARIVRQAKTVGQQKTDCFRESGFHVAHVPDGYRALWIGVLAQAVSDVTNPSQGEFFRQARRDAIRWFKHGGRDFNEVCHLAGLDPEAVRDRFQAGRLQYIKINRHAQRRTG